jgi:DNA-binding Lrp family transcriptional regulator
MSADTGTGGGWTFLTNHAHVLLVVRRDPHARLREIAEAVGVTERAVQLILSDLEAAGYLTRTKVGRRNEYAVLGGPMRHPLEHDHAVDDLLDALGAGPPAGTPAPRPRRG